MQRMMRKIWKLPLIAWLLIMLFIGIAIGAVMYTLIIPGTITILPAPEGTYEIKVYSDAAATQELTSIDFGSVRAGGSVPVSFYVKNTGTVTIGVMMTIEISGVSTSTYGTIIENLEPQQIRYVSQTLWIRPQAGAGTYSVTIKLEAFA